MSALHKLLSSLSEDQVTSIAKTVGCQPEALSNAIETIPGYRDHSVALHQIEAIMLGDPEPAEPWPDGVDHTMAIDRARSVMAGLRACWSLVPGQAADEVASRRLVAVTSGHEAEVLRDLRTLHSAGPVEAVLADDLDEAEQRREEHGIEHVVQLGWAPGLVRVNGRLMSMRDWLSSVGWTQ